MLSLRTDAAPRGLKGEGVTAVLGLTPGPAPGSTGGILVGDESALFYYLHSDAESQGCVPVRCFDLHEECAISSEALCSFNTQHPLFGGEPVSVLVPWRNLRIRVGGVVGRLCTSRLPFHSVLQIRQGLYICSPELVFVRMACRLTDAQLVEAGMNLCARYFLRLDTEAIEEKASFATTPKRLQAYVDRAAGLRGCGKAERALRWVLPNSGSPMETKMALQFRLPLRMGGFGLPFDAMNYDIRAGVRVQLCEQRQYCIDMVSSARKVGMEYDGEEYHRDVTSDLRRRNALLAMGWKISPVDKGILLDPEATVKLGHQVAKNMGIRLQKPRNWEQRFEQLRIELQLPV